MKKAKIAIILLIILGGIVAILINNKTKMAAKTEVEKNTKIPVVVTTPVNRRLAASFELVGTTAANYDVAIASEVQGKVVAVYVNVGDHVNAGSPIMKIDDELKHAALEAAEVNYQKTKRDLERFEVLHKDSTVSDSQIESARLAFKAAEAQYISAKRIYNDTKITSPISGVVTSRPIDIGAMVMNANIVANVVDISKLKVKVNVAEKDVFTIKTGDAVTITSDVYPGITFNGVVKTISAKGDESHTYPVEISLPNSGENQLKAGMFARVGFTSKSERNAWVIPRNALVGSTRHAKVFVVENDIAKLRSITLGVESEEFLEVLDGISEGDKIVVDGKNNLKDGYTVIITTSANDKNN